MTVRKLEVRDTEQFMRQLKKWLVMLEKQ